MRTITLNDDDMREPCEHNDLVTCGHCNRSWCGTCTPTPSARCAFEYEHEYDEDQEFAAFLTNNDIKIDPNAPLAPHGGCNWSGCKTCFPPKDEPTNTDFPYRDDADDEIKFRTPEPTDTEGDVEILLDGEYVTFRPVSEILSNKANGPDYEAEFLDAAIVNDIVRENVNLKANGPCPVCSEANGFHNEGTHRKNIDPKHMLKKGWHQK